MRAHGQPITWPRLAELAGMRPVPCWDIMRDMLKQEKIVRSHVENHNYYYKPADPKPQQESLIL